MRKTFVLLRAVPRTFRASVTSAQEQFPIMDKIAESVIQKYQQSSCQQLLAERGQPKVWELRNGYSLDTSASAEWTEYRQFVEQAEQTSVNSRSRC